MKRGDTYNITIDESINIQKWIQDNLFAYNNVTKSTNMAIKSLEIWKKLEEELKQKCCGEMMYDIAIWEVIIIVKNYIKELEKE